MNTTTEVRLVCGGRGKPWHLQGSNREHVWLFKKGVEAAIAEAARKSEVEDKTPLQQECSPWRVETRQVSKWVRMS